MKYRLKDRALQKKLDAIGGGDFTERLQEGVSKIAPVVVLSFGESPHEGRKHRYMATFKNEEIEEIPRYDPTKWNVWPYVTPPSETRLRVEVLTPIEGEGTPEVRGGKVRYRGCASYFQGFWLFGKDDCFLTLGETVRFRPWVDPNEENKE